MNISGLIVRALPAKLDKVRMQLVSLPGIEVHAFEDDGRIVVTIEEESDEQMVSTINELQDIDGVVGASMVYHHFEDLENETFAT